MWRNSNLFFVKCDIIIIMTVLELFGSFIILLDCCLLNCPVILDDLFFIFPGLDECCGPKWENDTINSVKCPIYGLFQSTVIPMVCLKCDKAEAYHRWQNKPWLVMDQECELEGILLAIVSLDEVHWLKIIVEVSCPEASHHGPLLFPVRLNYVVYVSFMERVVLQDDVLFCEVWKVEFLFKQAKYSFYPLPWIEHIEPILKVFKKWRLDL